MRYPDPLLKLISVLKKLPGVGNKTAERYAFHLLDLPQNTLSEIGRTIDSIKEKIQKCSDCGALLYKDNCLFCDRSKRRTDLMCVVASSKEIFSIEETGEYKGHYHVLEGLLSPFQPKPDLTIEELKKRITSLEVKEILLAFDATLEGDATALFLKKELASYPVKLTRLAFGIPMGSSFDYIDGGTLARAISGRQLFSE